MLKVVFSLALLVSAAGMAEVDPVAFVKDAIGRGEKKISVPVGKYRLANPLRFGEREKGKHVSGLAFFVLKDVKDAIIDFGGASLWGDRLVTMFHLDHCENVTIRNVKIDYPHSLPFTQGVIEEVGPDKEWTVRLVEGYPEVKSFGWPIQAYDAKSGELVNAMRMQDNLKVTRLADGRYRVSGGQNRRGEVGDIMVAAANGDVLMVGARLAADDHAVYVYNCARVRFENVTVYSTPGSNGFRETCGEGDNAYVNCRVVPCPPEEDPVKRGMPRYRSGSHDAFNSRSVKHGPTWDGCVARHHCDDDINVHGGYWMVIKREGRRVRAITSNVAFNTFVPGPVQLMQPDGTVAEDCPVIAERREGAPPSKEEVAMVKGYGLVQQLSNSIEHAEEFTLESEDERFVPGAVFVPQNAGGNHFVIRNCHFGPNRARALILNASYGLVENCVFDHTEGQGIRSSSSYPWLEGGCCRETTVRNCTFLDCDCYFGAVLGKRHKLPENAHRGISIVGNTFKGRSRLAVEGCRGLTLKDNTFECPADRRVTLTNVSGVDK